MKYLITESDKSLVLQPSLSYRCQILLQNEKKLIVNTLEDFTLDSFTVDGSSDMRRNISVTVHLKNGKSPDQLLHTWLPLNFRLQIGLENQQNQNYTWYECGTYALCDTSAAYDASTNTLSLSLNDSYSRLNGTRNGQIGGAPSIEYPSEDETGKKFTIQSQLVNFLQSEGMSDIIVEEIGEFYGYAANNPDGYLEYRRNNPNWDKMPHDIALSAGCTAADVVREFIGFCPNVQAYFDIYNNFCVNMIPTCEFQPAELDWDFLENILVKENSENVSLDLRKIKNITEVFGGIYEIDRTAESCTSSGNVYQLTISEYEKYKSNDIIAFIPQSANLADSKIRINELAVIPICREFSDASIPSGTIQAGEMYAGILKLLENKQYVFYFLGQFQPHALCVLTDSLDHPVYTKKYFAEKYNCKEVTLRAEPGSPFTVQHIGEVLDVKSGNDFENIESHCVAMENAIYQNTLSSSMRDTIQIVTKFLPWLDVNMKVRYRRAADKQINIYLIQSVAHQPDSFTSTITMTRFYPLSFQ